MKIYAGSDHAGFKLRKHLVQHLQQKGFEVVDVGPESPDRTDYPDWAAKVARAVRADAGSLGVLACGSGLGMCMTANKVRGIRAAEVWNPESAKLSRQHNDANVMCIGERLVDEKTAVETMDAFLGAQFEGGRHADRVKKIAQIEDEESKR